MWRSGWGSNPRTFLQVYLISSQSRYPDFERKRRKLTDNARVCKPLKNQHFSAIDRELHPEVYRAPDRWYQERSGHYNSRVTYRNELTKLSEEERANFRKYMEDEFCQYGDLLTVVEVAEAIGYCDTSLHRWCNAKKLKSFNISGKFLIPKISLVDFLVSQYSFDITRKTWKHTLLIKSFLDRLDTTE